MPSFKLYQIQDADRPMYVVAVDYPAALNAWQRLVREENEGKMGEPPDGIAAVCGASDLLLPWEDERTDG